MKWNQITILLSIVLQRRTYVHQEDEGKVMEAGVIRITIVFTEENMYTTN